MSIPRNQDCKPLDLSEAWLPTGLVSHYLPFAILTFVASIVTSAPAKAEAPTQTSRANETETLRGARIQIVLVGHAANTDGDLEALVSEWLGAETVVAIRRRPSLTPEEILSADPDGVPLRVWVVLIAPTLGRLYFATSEGTRFLVRDVPLRNALDELGKESVAQILASSVGDFLEQRASSTPQQVVRSFDDNANDTGSSPPASISRAPALPPGPPDLVEANRQRRESSWSFGLGVLYGISLRGVEGALHGPGLRMGWAHGLGVVRSVFAARAQLLGSIHPSTTEHTTLSLSGMSLRTTWAMEWNVGAWLFLGPELGAGIDVVEFSARSLPALPVVFEKRGRDVRPFVLLALRAGAVSHEDWRASVSVGVNAMLTRTRYDVIQNGEAREEAEPWRIQPAACVEVAWR